MPVLERQGSNTADVATQAYPDPDGPANASTPANGAKDETSDSDVANYVRQLFFRARDARRPLVAQWKRNYRTLNNKAWKPNVDSWTPAPNVSQVWPVVFSSVAWLTDQRPTIEVIPAMQPFSPYADYYQSLATDMNSCLNATFTGNNLDAELNKMLWDVYQYGIGYLKTTWEPYLADGLGDSAFRRVDPFTMYPDPFAKSELDASYFCEVKVMTVADVDRAWPGAGSRLAGKALLEKADEAPHRLDEQVNQNSARVALGNLSPNTNTKYAVSDKDRMGMVRDEPVVTVIECWVRDHEAIKETDEHSKVVDTWRCIVVCGNVVLLDAPAEEVNAYGTHPYSRCVIADTGEWYGVGLVELLDSSQDSITRILTSVEQNIALMGNPVLLESQRSPSKQKRIANRPGERIPVSRPEDVTWLMPPQMAPQMAIDLIQFYKGEIESISGLSAMVRGFAPGGRNAQGVLDTVQDAAFVRVRATLREIERCLRSVSSRMCANIAEFYTEPRFMAQIGQDGQRTHLALRARHFYTRDATNPKDRIPLRFQLLADAGSQLPTSKQARSADAEKLFALGAIDIFELLKAKQWPNFALVAKRVMDLQAQGALNPPGKRTATRS